MNSFYKQGPKTLYELQEQVSNGNLSWLHRISYYSNRVTGSSAYWRAKRQEAFSWINFHLGHGNGVPSFFITLSCAEYHWKDIERLIVDRNIAGGLPAPDMSKGRVGLINDFTIVVQEYFQAQVKVWLDTVGRELLKIKHYWLRFEFAPSRGQIHAHMLVICDNKEIMRKCHELRENKPKLAKFLGAWLKETIGMSASLPEAHKTVDTKTEPHPSGSNFSDVPEDRQKLDSTLCHVCCHSHNCSKYCMNQRKFIPKTETVEQKKRKVCRCGAGVEVTAGECNTPGFKIRKEPCIVRDLRGFDRVDMPRNHRRITQCATYVAQGWRGNCDIQYLIYTSDPDNIDASDVSRVTNYVVSYSCKGSETEMEQKLSMKDLILAAKEEEGDIKDVRRIAKRLLNDCSKKE